MYAEREEGAVREGSRRRGQGRGATREGSRRRGQGRGATREGSRRRRWIKMSRL